ncbi:MAG: hypothetical protein HY757_10725 [Nitrospirae bacterium]|nr:hypothetical protein [Nitrospirota bacterium]
MEFRHIKLILDELNDWFSLGIAAAEKVLENPNKRPDKSGRSFRTVDQHLDSIEKSISEFKFEPSSSGHKLTIDQIKDSSSCENFNDFIKHENLMMDDLNNMDIVIAGLKDIDAKLSKLASMLQKFGDISAEVHDKLIGTPAYEAWGLEFGTMAFDNWDNEQIAYKIQGKTADHLRNIRKLKSEMQTKYDMFAFNIQESEKAFGNPCDGKKAEANDKSKPAFPEPPSDQCDDGAWDNWLIGLVRIQSDFYDKKDINNAHKVNKHIEYWQASRKCKNAAAGPSKKMESEKLDDALNGMVEDAEKGASERLDYSKYQGNFDSKGLASGMEGISEKADSMSQYYEGEKNTAIQDSMQSAMNTIQGYTDSKLSNMGGGSDGSVPIGPDCRYDVNALKARMKSAEMRSIKDMEDLDMVLAKGRSRGYSLDDIISLTRGQSEEYRTAISKLDLSYQQHRDVKVVYEDGLLASETVLSALECTKRGKAQAESVNTSTRSSSGPYRAPAFKSPASPQSENDSYRSSGPVNNSGTVK